jgi:hypothetical protein
MVQNQRGALALVGDRVYVPYGGHDGDCGDYHGWVVAVNVQHPDQVASWATRAQGGGIWAPSGIATDGARAIVATGNTFNASEFADGEAVMALTMDGTQSHLVTQDYWAASNWSQLDDEDLDVGGTGPLIVDVPSATPAKLIVALGKDGYAYLVSRDHLGGIGQEIQKQKVASNIVVTAAATYTTAKGAYVVFRGRGSDCPTPATSDLTALRITATNPPKIETAWCAYQNGRGSPIATLDQAGNTVVWGIGAEGDNRLKGFDGDTGAVVFAGGGRNDGMTTVRRFQTPIAAGGRIFVAADGKVYAFTP